MLRGIESQITHDCALEVADEMEWDLPWVDLNNGTFDSNTAEFAQFKENVFLRADEEIQRLTNLLIVIASRLFYYFENYIYKRQKRQTAIVEKFKPQMENGVHTEKMRDLLITKNGNREFDLKQKLMDLDQQYFTQLVTAYGNDQFANHNDHDGVIATAVVSHVNHALAALCRHQPTYFINKPHMEGVFAMVFLMAALKQQFDTRLGFVSRGHRGLGILELFNGAEKWINPEMMESLGLLNATCRGMVAKSDTQPAKSQSVTEGAHRPATLKLEDCLAPICEDPYLPQSKTWIKYGPLKDNQNPANYVRLNNSPADVYKWYMFPPHKTKGYSFIEEYQTQHTLLQWDYSYVGHHYGNMGPQPSFPNDDAFPRPFKERGNPNMMGYQWHNATMRDKKWYDEEHQYQEAQWLANANVANNRPGREYPAKWKRTPDPAHAGANPVRYIESPTMEKEQWFFLNTLLPNTDVDFEE